MFRGLLGPRIITTTSPGNLCGVTKAVSPHHNPLVYIAGAYSGDIAANIAKAELVSITLIRNGWHVLTPHKNTSGYEKYEDECITKNTWLEMDKNLLRHCDLMYVLDNWRESVGTQEEMIFAESVRIPIFYEETIPMGDFTPAEVRKSGYFKDVIINE